MNHSVQDTSMSCKTKLTSLHDLSIVDAEHFEPPQLSSTPFKTINNFKRISKDNNKLNISMIKKKDQKKKGVGEIDNPQFKSMMPIIENNLKYDQVPELFSDPIDTTVTGNDTTFGNDSDDTFYDISEDRSHRNVSGFLAEIGDNLESKFRKPPKRSYLGRKRNYTSIYQEDDGKENEEKGNNRERKNKKHKEQKYIDPQDDALIQSLNEHFNDVESFNLTVE